MLPKITINRAPVLTLWGAVVAEHMGFDHDAALTLGKALAGLNAQAKGRRLGIFTSRSGGAADSPRKSGLGEEFWIELCGRPIPAKRTKAGVRAVVKDVPIEPESVEAYLRRSFGENLADARSAMERLAASFDAESLTTEAFGLYEKFRPSVARGQAGWGQKGSLDLRVIDSLCRPR